ncbi:hypothetical protein HGRIS_010222 [Hohenbuehelia grisea]|uniref:Uncharacterized protein n=1 Tax=Hohenbuehelia grisea TaxID=104357 RepID=A0ABR3J3L6_9AGAR
MDAQERRVIEALPDELKTIALRCASGSIKSLQALLEYIWDNETASCIPLFPVIYLHLRTDLIPSNSHPSHAPVCADRVTRAVLCLKCIYRLSQKLESAPSVETVRRSILHKAELICSWLQFLTRHYATDYPPDEAISAEDLLQICQEILTVLVIVHANQEDFQHQAGSHVALLCLDAWAALPRVSITDMDTFRDLNEVFGDTLSHFWYTKPPQSWILCHMGGKVRLAGAALDVLIRQMEDWYQLRPDDDQAFDGHFIQLSRSLTRVAIMFVEKDMELSPIASRAVPELARFLLFINRRRCSIYTQERGPQRHQSYYDKADPDGSIYNSHSRRGINELRLLENGWRTFRLILKSLASIDSIIEACELGLLKALFMSGNLSEKSDSPYRSGNIVVRSYI